MPELKVIQPQDLPGPGQADRSDTSAKRTHDSRWKPQALRLYRLAVVLAIVWLIHRHHARLRIDGDAPIKIEEVRPFFPAAASLEVDDTERMGLHVLDGGGNRVGYVLRTSPISNKITGYAGPTDTLVALDNGMRVIGVRIRSSLDTRDHVADVAKDEYFMGSWAGKGWEEIAGTDPREAGIEGVSGASLTSMAIANGIRHRFRHSVDAVAAAGPRPPEWRGVSKSIGYLGGLATYAWSLVREVRPSWHDYGLVAVILVAVLFTFTNLRSRTWLRRTFQAVLVGYVGLVNGQILAQSLFAGWASNNVPWRLAPGLALLAAAALIVPWATRRQLYCSHICPHGAAQEWVGRITKRRLTVPRGVDRGLRWLPPLLIALVLTVTITGLPFDLADIEPFDAYVLRAAGVATIAIAVAGLIAATFVPMAYCKYGCPTGLVLSFVRAHGKADHLGRRDVGAALLVVLTVVLYLKYEGIRHWITG